MLMKFQYKDHNGAQNKNKNPINEFSGNLSNQKNPQKAKLRADYFLQNFVVSIDRRHSKDMYKTYTLIYECMFIHVRIHTSKGEVKTTYTFSVF